MPKCSPAKRRKKGANKDKTCKQSKKATGTKKEEASEENDEKTKVDFEDENVGLAVDNEDACSEQSFDIDQSLDRNALKSNLSVFNVKSIIHHVLSDERVVDMVRQVAEDDEDKDDISSKEDSILPSIIEPKLTRSRVRQVAKTIGTVPDPLLLVKETIIHSPVKNVISPFKRKRSEKINTPDKFGEPEESGKDDIPEDEVPLADLSFSEGGSSDEEYDPLNDDGSEDDSESCLSNTSDLASPEPLRCSSRAKRRLLADPSRSPQPDDSQKDDDVSLKPEEELSSPFKVPLPLTKSAEKKENVKTDLIATRTRSRLPLTDTSLETIEAQFILPDLTPDLYDIINLEDLEQDDIDWQKWLFGLNTEKGAIDTDDPEDSEYNFMAEEQKEEQEEYRTDRAVKISQRELTELFEQFFTEFGDEIPMGESSSSQTQSTTDASVIQYGEEIAITLPQRQCLITQLQKHTQLLVQVSLLCKRHADLKLEADTCEGLLQDMVQLSDVASSNYVSNLVGNKDASPTVFSSVGLSEAVRLTNQTVSSFVPAGTSSALKPGDESREVTSALPIPEEMCKIMSSSPVVFIYKSLLPHIQFYVQKSSSGRGEKFLQCEDNLLVLGLDQYGNKWHNIKRHYLPVKTLNQIKIRRKNLCSNRAPDNVVKQYKKTGKIPMLPTIPAVVATEERHRPPILPASSEKGVIPMYWMQRNETSQSGKKITKKKKNVKTSDSNVPIISPPSLANKVPTIILKDPTCEMNVPTDVVAKSQPSLADAKTNVAIKNMNSTNNQIPARITISSSKEKMRAILPYPPSIPKDATKIPEFPQQGAPTRECSPALNTTPAAVDSDHSCTILQGSEKENIQPISEETQCENANDCGIGNSGTDTNEDIKARAMSYAQCYLNNVKKVVKEDSPTYQAFLRVLVDSKTNAWSPEKLYKEISVVLNDFPDLVRDFVGFLEPHQALDVGVFMTNKNILKARMFLQHVERHFSKNPSHFQKIIKAFSAFKLLESESSQLYDTIIPLLKGQQFLIEEFNSFFNHLKPQPCQSDDFEEVDLGSGSEVEVDDFEEIVIPDVKKNLTKTREFVKIAVKPAVMSKKHRKVKKDDTNDKNIDESIMDYDKDNDMREDPLERTDEINDDTVDNYDKALDSDDDFDEPADKTNSDCETQEIQNDTEMPLSTKYNSDLSNPSSPASECKSVEDPFDEDDMESLETTQESHVTSASEATSDLSNEATDVPAISTVSSDSLEQCENPKQTEQTPRGKTTNTFAESNVLKPQNIECNIDGSTPDAIDEIQEESSEITNKEQCSNNLRERISANNLEVDEDGTSVIWTREDDRKILQSCQTRGLSDNIYQDIAQELGNKTPLQVKGRFRVLVSLLPRHNDENSSSDQSESEGDEESCNETEEN